jgi:hypothetical protein
MVEVHDNINYIISTIVRLQEDSNVYLSKNNIFGNKHYASAIRLRKAVSLWTTSSSAGNRY